MFLFGYVAGVASTLGVIALAVYGAVLERRKRG